MEAVTSSRSSVFPGICSSFPVKSILLNFAYNNSKAARCHLQKKKKKKKKGEQTHAVLGLRRDDLLSPAFPCKGHKQQQQQE
jgi:hypothetical protein